MKISLSPEVSEELTELRLIAGYESTQALIRILLKLYKDDFKGRFQRAVSLSVIHHLNDSEPPKPAPKASSVPPQLTQQALATPNPPPEW